MYKICSSRMISDQMQRQGLLIHLLGFLPIMLTDGVLPLPQVILGLCTTLWTMIATWLSVACTRPDTSGNYDIDEETGFVPAEPLPRLSEPFDTWERALEGASETLCLGEYTDDDEYEEAKRQHAGRKWRDDIRGWSVLSTKSLQGDLRRLQRAHLVLAWLVHFFVHSIPLGGDEDPDLVPRTLAVPLVEVSGILGMNPVVTYADIVLWNWERIDPDRPTTMENINFTNLFSGTDDERNFYVAMARAELRGGEAIGIIDDFIRNSSRKWFIDTTKIAGDLWRLAGIITDLIEISQTIRSTCERHVFYWAIRPWFEGSGTRKGCNSGWKYEGVEESEKLELDGPSGGQSSLFHALDLFLDVDHKFQRCPVSGNQGSGAFMVRMRRYMPGRHRDWLGRVRSVRRLAQKNAVLLEPYNATVMALKKLRDVHMRMACLYIVTMSRSNPSGRPGCPVSQMMERMHKLNDNPVRGTGGNEIRELLEAGRIATRRTLLRGPQ